MEKISFFQYAQSMTKREIPEKDPELEPGEKPASHEIEWLLKELPEDGDPESIHRLRRVDITISEQPNPLQKKTAGLLPPAVGESSEKAGESIETLKNDIDRHEHEVNLLLAELKGLRENIERSIRPDDQDQAGENREKLSRLRDLIKKIKEAESSVEIIESIKELLIAVKTDSPKGRSLYAFGAFVIKSFSEIARQRVNGHGPDSEVLMTKKIQGLGTEFKAKYEEYRKNRGI